MAQNSSQRRIERLLGSMERDLIDWIPIAVQDLKVTAQAYCLFLWYQDYESDWLPHLGVATQALLDDAAKTTFESVEDRFDFLWCPQQWGASDTPGRLFLDECELVDEAVGECYELLAEASGLEDLPDNEAGIDPQLQFDTLRPFREMMHRVGRQLKQNRWAKSLHPTDDFALVVSDYMGIWLDVDLPLSIDSEQWNRLVASNMLPPN